jgi:hypothetical protein
MKTEAIQLNKGSSRAIVRKPELARILGVHHRTVSNWMSDRIIPFFKVRRSVMFDIGEVFAALGRHRVAALDEPRLRKRRILRVGEEIA